MVFTTVTWAGPECLLCQCSD